MDLKQLKYFSRIVELESITAAAQALFVAQPSLSQHVANLEAELGTRLLNRGPHGAQPTAAGELLYNYANTILRQVNDAVVAIKQEGSTPVGRVSVGLPTSTSRILSVDLIDTISRAHPNVALEIVEGGTSQLADMVGRQRLDLALAVDVQPNSKFDVRPLLSEQLLVVVPAAASLQPPVDLETLCEHPLILSPFPNSVRVKMESACSARDLQYQVVAETSAASVMSGTVKRGLAWTILPWSALQGEDGVQSFEIDDPHFRRTLFLCTSKLGATNGACELVSETLVQLIREKVDAGLWKFARPLSV